MTQAIVTKYLPCTNTKPARVKAGGSGDRAPYIIVPYDTCAAEDGPYYAHKRAAEAFAHKFKWFGRWYGQELARGFVFINEARVSFNVERQ